MRSLLSFVAGCLFAFGMTVLTLLCAGYLQANYVDPGILPHTISITFSVGTVELFICSCLYLLFSVSVLYASYLNANKETDSTA